MRVRPATHSRPGRPTDGRCAMLDRTQIEAILPHRDPFLFLDRVIELVPGEYVVAEKDLLPTLDVFRGHFPGHPVFPGVLQLEAIAQAGAVAILSRPGSQGKIILFGRADEVKFRREVGPGADGLGHPDRVSPPASGSSPGAWRRPLPGSGR